MAVKFKVNTQNLQRGITRLIRDHRESCKRAAGVVGEFLVGEAKARAPVDTGQLTQDITHTGIIGSNDITIVIYVPVNAPSAKYAVKMHEWEYALGVKSRAKQARVSVTVGRKYLSRAIDDNREEIMETFVKELRL